MAGPFSGIVAEHRDAIREVLKSHAVIMFGLTCLGYFGYSLVQSLLGGWGDIGVGGSVATDSAELLAILRNNLVFFTVVCCLPILNAVLVIPQFLVLGVKMRLISELPLGVQFVLLYRHTVLEIIALFLALGISYGILLSSKKFLDSSKLGRAVYGRQLRALLPAYVLTVVLTLVGAVLEGTVHVHV